MLRKLGVWEQFTDATPVFNMYIYGPNDAKLEIDTEQASLPVLCTTVEAKELTSVLANSVESSANIDLVIDQTINNLVTTKTDVLVSFDKQATSCKLLIGADGAKSTVAKLANLDNYTSFEKTPFSAVVGRITLPKLRFEAKQWMTEQKVVALLPGPKHRACIIWSQQSVLANQTMQLSDEQFMQELTKVGGDVVEQATDLSMRKSFPIYQFLRPVVSQRVVLVGESAHGFHPLAGQGLTVSMGDVDYLLAITKKSDPGNYSLLKQYQRQRLLRAKTTLFTTGELAKLADSTNGQLLLAAGLNLPTANILGMLANLQ